MGKYILSAYYGKIFFNFMAQDSPADTILVLEGFPASGKSTEEMEFLYSKGFNVIWPHYPGTYQSRGKFLDKDLIQELASFVDSLSEGKVTSLWDLSEIKINTKRLFLFGGSFGGAISCGLATLRNFDKVVLFSPVWDFSKHNQEGNEQDLDALIPFVKRAYENLFRFDWNELISKIIEIKECSSDYYKSKLHVPLLVLHDPSDKTVSIEHTLQMKKIIPLELIKHNNGHSMGKSLEPEWNKISKFLR